MLLPTQDGLLFAFILGVLLLRAIPAAALEAGVVPGQTGAGDAASNTASKPESDVILVTGVPSVIEVPSQLFGVPPPQCVDFAIESVGKVVPELHITSAGVGGARLLELTAARSGENCAASVSAAASTIVLTNVGDTERAVRLFLPESAFPSAAKGDAGKLIVVRPGAPATILPFVLQRKEYAPYQRALLWFGGVALPLSIGALITLLGFAAQKRIESRASERDALVKFRADEAVDLKTFFEGLYKTTVQLVSDDDYQATMERELQQMKIFRALSWNQVQRLRKSLRARRRGEVGDQLSAVFPDNADAIRAAYKKSEK